MKARPRTDAVGDAKPSQTHSYAPVVGTIPGANTWEGYAKHAKGVR